MRNLLLRMFGTTVVDMKLAPLSSFPVDMHFHIVSERKWWERKTHTRTIYVVVGDHEQLYVAKDLEQVEDFIRMCDMFSGSNDDVADIFDGFIATLEKINGEHR